MIQDLTWETMFLCPPKHAFYMNCSFLKSDKVHCSRPSNNGLISMPLSCAFFFWDIGFAQLSLILSLMWSNCNFFFPSFDMTIYMYVVQIERSNSLHKN